MLCVSIHVILAAIFCYFSFYFILKSVHQFLFYFSEMGDSVSDREAFIANFVRSYNEEDADVGPALPPGFVPDNTVIVDKSGMGENDEGNEEDDEDGTVSF